MKIQTQITVIVTVVTIMWEIKLGDFLTTSATRLLASEGLRSMELVPTASAELPQIKVR
jgi:hypothetical protein